MPPSNKIQPIGITASKTAPGSAPCNAVDGKTGTVWNAGALPSQWIELDLGRPMAIGKVRLNMQMTRPGTIHYTISVGADHAHMRDVYTPTVASHDGAWLESSGDGNPGAGGEPDRVGNARYVRITFNSGPASVALREIEVYSGVQYVGYYYAGGTPTQNAQMIVADPANPSDFIASIQQLAANGQKAFVVPLVTVSRDSQLLAPDWRTRWKKISPVIKAQVASVAAFYPVDEPYSNGNNAADLADMAAAMHKDFPTIPIASFLAVSELSRAKSDFAMFDWIGFDYYYQPESTFGGFITQLRGLLSRPEQRMIAAPLAAVWPTNYISDTGVSGQSAIISTNIDPWQAELLSDARYAAILPFLWLDSGGSTTGANKLPWVADRVDQLQAAVMPSKSPRVYPASVKASSSYSSALPYAAIDGDESTMWNSGTYAQGTPWIETDLAGLTHVTRVDLEVAQTPAGYTFHTLLGLDASGTWSTLHVFQGSTSDGQHLTWSGSADVTALKVETSATPSWVAWREIAIFDDAQITCDEVPSYPLSITVNNEGCGSIPLTLSGSMSGQVDAATAGIGQSNVTFPGHTTVPVGSTVSVQYAPVTGTCNCSTSPTSFPYHGAGFTVIPSTTVSGTVGATLYCGPIIT